MVPDIWKINSRSQVSQYQLNKGIFIELLISAIYELSSAARCHVEDIGWDNRCMLWVKQILSSDYGLTMEEI